MSLQPDAGSPLLKHYAAIKQRYPDALVLFKVGEFYEAFGEDAVRISRRLDIVLTQNPSPEAAFSQLTGFPAHRLDAYLSILLKAGYRVALCDQEFDKSA